MLSSNIRIWQMIYGYTIQAMFERFINNSVVQVPCDIWTRSTLNYEREKKRIKKYELSAFQIHLHKHCIPNDL